MTNSCYNVIAGDSLKYAPHIETVSIEHSNRIQSI